MRIVLLGAPGAGKGTQAKILAQALQLSHVSTGDLLRRNVSQQSTLGKEAQGYMNRGVLVPDELIDQMLRERFSRDDVAKGFILDGYPRNTNQAKTLDTMLSALAMNIDYVFNLAASEAVIIQRLGGRLVCQSCQANYHVTNMPPKTSGTCDACGGRLYQRSDDKEETIRRRLEVYANESAPLIAYYQERGKLYTVGADTDARDVLKEILAIVERHNDSLKV